MAEMAKINPVEVLGLLNAKPYTYMEVGHHWLPFSFRFQICFKLEPIWEWRGPERDLQNIVFLLNSAHLRGVCAALALTKGGVCST